MRTTDRERAARLRVLAERVVRRNRARHFQMPWAEVVLAGVPDTEELYYQMAAAPSVLLRLLRKLERLDP